MSNKANIKSKAKQTKDTEYRKTKAFQKNS